MTNRLPPDSFAAVQGIVDGGLGKLGVPELPLDQANQERISHADNSLGEPRNAVTNAFVRQSRRRVGLNGTSPRVRERV